MKLEQFLTVPYIDGGRDISVGLDCWGLVRHVLHDVFKAPLLECFAGIDRHTQSLITQGYEKSVVQFKRCQPKAGAVACCFHSTGAMHHVGVCINDHQVLHTSSKKGVCILKLRVFKRLANRVEFFELINEVGNK